MSQDEKFETRARHAFEEAVAGLDEPTTKRLRLMRREAQVAARPSPVMRWLTAAVFAAGVLAVGLAWRASSPGITPPAGTSTTGPEVAVDLASEEDAALYAWLGEAPVAAEGEPL